MDWLYYYQLLAPLILGLALRCWAGYAHSGNWLLLTLGILSAGLSFHGLFLLSRQLLEGPNYNALPFLLIILMLVYSIITVRLYRSLGSTKSSDTASN